MEQQEQVQQGHFTVLDQDECRELLRLSRIGRVGYLTAGAINIIPVAYAIVEGDIVLKTAVGSALAKLPSGEAVAFQIDEFDEETRTGWSVLVNGDLRQRESQNLEIEVTPWALGPRELVMAITPRTLSGRAVSAAN